MFHVVFHRNCSDGTAAMQVVKRWIGDRPAKYYAAQYKEPVPMELTEGNLNRNEDDVIIVDFSFPRAELERMSTQARSFLVLDHHAGVKGELEGIEGCHFDNDHSGAMMAWLHFFPDEEAPEIIKHVEDRDLWRFNLPHTDVICAAAKHNMRDEQFWQDSMNGWSRDQKRDIMVLGETLLEVQEAAVAKSVRTAIRTRLFEYRTSLANVTEHISEVGHSIVHQLPVDFSTTYFITREGKVVLSFRSKPEFDVSEIARRLGGNGHKNAAGAVVDLDFLKVLYSVRIEEDE